MLNTVLFLFAHVFIVSLPNNGDTLSNTSMDNASTENNDTPGITNN